MELSSLTSSFEWLDVGMDGLSDFGLTEVPAVVVSVGWTECSDELCVCMYGGERKYYIY